MTCVFSVVLVTVLCALFARCGADKPVETTPPSETSSIVEVIVTPEVTVTVTAAPTTAPPESTAEPTTALPETTFPIGTEETTTETTTFTSVAEESGVRRIENFIFCETDSPLYRLARLLYCEVPPVVKTAEVTETVATDETSFPAETTVETTKETTETSILTDEEGNVVETTAETYTYEVDGVCALYYKDLYDGEVMVFNPKEVIFGASMIKAVYVFALLQKAEAEEIDLKEEIIYKEEMFVEGSGDFKNVKSGTVFTVEELIRRTIRRSDNTAFSMLQKRYGTAFFPEVCEAHSLYPTRFGSWWRTNVTNYGNFFSVLAEYLTAENKYGEWLAENMCESLQSVMLQRALRPEKVAHKYGWDEDSYCDGAVVLSENPYVLVFMSNMDEGHTKAANTSFIYEVGGIIKQLHDEKHALLAAKTSAEVSE